MIHGKVNHEISFRKNLFHYRIKMMQGVQLYFQFILFIIEKIIKKPKTQKRLFINYYLPFD
jgi:hypothetical protein